MLSRVAYPVGTANTDLALSLQSGLVSLSSCELIRGGWNYTNHFGQSPSILGFLPRGAFFIALLCEPASIVPHDCGLRAGPL